MSVEATLADDNFNFVDNNDDNNNSNFGVYLDPSLNLLTNENEIMSKSEEESPC